MTQAILSAFVLGPNINSAILAFRFTLFDAATRQQTATQTIFPSLEDQLQTGRDISDLGLVDMLTAPKHWVQDLVDPSQMMSPRDAAQKLAATLNKCTCVWVPEFRETCHTLDSFSQQYAPEYNGHTYGTVLQCADFATRDCRHSTIISSLCLPYARQA